MFKKNISTVLIASVAAAIVAAIAIIVLYVSRSSYNMTLELEQQSMQQVNQGTQEALDAYMRSTQTLVETLAAQKAIHEAFEGDATRAKDRLHEYIKINKEYWAIFLFDAKGTILAGYNAKEEDLAGQSRADRDYVKAVLGGQDLFIANQIIKAKSGDGELLIFSLAKAVKSKDGKVLGGVGAFPKWEAFTSAFLDKPRFGKRGYGFMLDAKGRIIGHAVDKSLLLKDLSDVDFVKQALAKKNGTFFYDWKGEQKFMSVSTDKDTGWTLCMSAYVEEMTETASMQRNVLMGVGAGAVLALVVIIGFIIRRLVVRPVGAVVDFTGKITQGDYKAELGTDFRYELAHLADNIRAMVAEIKNRLGFAQGVLSGFVLPCAVFDTENRMTFVNEHMIKALDKTGRPEDFLGQTSGGFLWEDEGRETLSMKAMRENRMLTTECEHTSVKGVKRTFSVTTTPFADLDGHIMGTLAVWFDLSEIREQQRKIAEQNEKIAKAAAAATAVSDQVASASEQLSAQIEQSSRGTDEQRARTGEAATAMEEMNATVMEVARSASTASELAEKAKTRAQEGERLVEEVVATIGQVNKQAEVLKADMGELGKQAQGIDQIMNVIADNAAQTNLLALNAAIEAARAGDAGRGFAVVADEVRKLAEKTMSATNEVGSYIKAVQESAKKNIEGTEAATRAVEQSNELAGRSGLALREIVGMVERTADQVRGIATASEEQSAASEEINHTTESINRIASETAEAMRQSAQAVSDLSRLAQELKTIINNMKD